MSGSHQSFTYLSNSTSIELCRSPRCSYIRWKRNESLKSHSTLSTGGLNSPREVGTRFGMSQSSCRSSGQYANLSGARCTFLLH